MYVCDLKAITASEIQQILIQNHNFNVIEFTLKTCAVHRFDFNAIYCIGYVHATLGSLPLGGH